METIKRRIRAFSLKKGDTDFDNHSEADEDTQHHLQKEIDDAEKAGHDTGRPGSFLNKLILHGNKKTEEQFRQAQQAQ